MGKMIAYAHSFDIVMRTKPSIGVHVLARISVGVMFKLTLLGINRPPTPMSSHHHEELWHWWRKCHVSTLHCGHEPFISP